MTYEILLADPSGPYELTGPTRLVGSMSVCPVPVTISRPPYHSPGRARLDGLRDTAAR
ncbi:MAG TPA: hypothetical protein VIL34_09965 [Actinopolymorphaceae bacterium]